MILALAGRVWLSLPLDTRREGAGTLREPNTGSGDNHPSVGDTTWDRVPWESEYSVWRALRALVRTHTRSPLRQARSCRLLPAVACYGTPAPVSSSPAAGPRPSAACAARTDAAASARLTPVNLSAESYGNTSPLESQGLRPAGRTPEACEFRASTTATPRLKNNSKQGTASRAVPCLAVLRRGWSAATGRPR